MNEEGFAKCLQAVLDDELNVTESFDPDGVREVATFAEAEVMTLNHGLVVRMDDGSEFQITIVRSR